MHKTNLVPAQAMAEAIDHDPQFRLPARPRFASSMLVLPMTDGLLIEGGAERQVFRGPGASTLLPFLLPLLDGTRTLTQVAAALPQVPLQAVKNAVALLYTRGVLDDREVDEGIDLTSVAPEIVEYCHRYIDVTRVHRGVGQTILSLHRTPVNILGEPKYTRLLVDALNQSGMNNVFIDNSDTSTLQHPADLAIRLILGSESMSQLTDLDDICAARGIKWLRSALVGTRVEIGPCFRRGETLCYRCFAKLNGPTTETRAAAPEDVMAWISISAIEVINLVSRISPPLSGRDLAYIDLRDWSQNRFRLPKLPGCAGCCPLPDHKREDIALAAAYEQAVNTPSKEFLDPKAHQLHYQTMNKELQRDRKQYQTAFCEYLGRADQTPNLSGSCTDNIIPSSTQATGHLNRQTLAGMLLRGGGLRFDSNAPQEQIRRWAPTAGNLGSVQIYVLAKRVEGLKLGCYFYQAHEHNLARLCQYDGCEDIQRLAELALVHEVDTDFAAILVLTAAFYRSQLKYGALAYRLVHLDAGAAIAQLAAVANGYGLQLRVARQWNDQVLADALALDGAEEPVTAVMVIPDSSTMREF